MYGVQALGVKKVVATTPKLSGCCTTDIMPIKPNKVTVAPTKAACECKQPNVWLWLATGVVIGWLLK